MTLHDYEKEMLCQMVSRYFKVDVTGAILTHKGRLLALEDVHKIVREAYEAGVRHEHEAMQP